MKDLAFLKHAAVYGMANMLVRAGSFILVPLYLHSMSQAENGVVEILDRLAETVGTMLLIGGLRQALHTLYQQTDDEVERKKIFGAAMLLVGCFCATIGGAALVGAGPLTDLLATDNGKIAPNLFRLAVLAILLEPLSLMPLALFQIRVHSGRFLVISASQFLVRVLLCFLLVGGCRMGAWGVLLATVATSGVYGVALSFRELVRSGAWPDWKQIGSLLQFALPFLPGGLGFLVMQHGDRFFLLKFLGEEEVATYGLGYKLALGVGMFSLGPLYMVWSSAMYRAAREPDAPVVFGRAFTRILAAYICVGLGLCLFQDEIVRLLGGAPYAHAAAIVAVVVCACFFQSAAALMDAGLYVSRRSGLKVGITLSSTFFMSVLYCIFIPHLGSMGAALATLGGFAFLAVVTWEVSQRVFPVRYEWGRVLLLLCLAVASWGLSRLLPAAWSWAPVKLGLFLLVPALVWQLGWLSIEEKAYLSAFVQTLLATYRRAVEHPSLPRIFRRPGPISETGPVVVPSAPAQNQLVPNQNHPCEELRYGNRLPWRDIQAIPVVARPTPTGRRDP